MKNSSDNFKEFMKQRAEASEAYVRVTRNRWTVLPRGSVPRPF